jgi:hypothetical protein
MARGTTACDPVTWQLRRCIAASTLSSRVRRFGAFVGLLPASLGLLQLAFVPVSENVLHFPWRQSAARWRCFAIFTCQFKTVTPKCNIIYVGNPYISPACFVAVLCCSSCVQTSGSPDNTPSLHTSFFCLKLWGCGFSFVLECLHGSGGGLRARRCVGHACCCHTATVGQPLSCPCILLRPMVI